ncbi:MAG: hypothetical protein IJZ73_06310 [Clostridia bacterium]|nr:hypothetical protein [Clostridia bacterium]
MREFYLEESVLIQNEKKAKTQYYIFFVVAFVAFFAGIFWFYSIFTISRDSYGLGTWLVLLLLPTLTFFSIAIFSYFIKNRFYTEYDYSILTGAIRFSKVINRAKRKQIVSISTDNIEKIGKFQSSTYIKYSKMKEISKKVLSPNSMAAEGKEFFYIVANEKGEKLLFVLECSKDFIKSLMIYCKRHVLEDDFK